MKVPQKSNLPEPQYPTRRQFSDYKTLLGVAAIGLSAVTGMSAPVRTAGVPRPPGGIKNSKGNAAETRPAETNCPIEQAPDVRLRGDIAVEPKVQQLPGTPPVVPLHTTNRQDRISYTIQSGDTYSSLALRFLGDRNRWPEIAKVNPGLKSDAIKTGQIILIPVIALTNKPPTPFIMGKIRSPK